MNIEFTFFPSNTQWVEGKAGKYKFRAKLYDKDSSYGIEEGRVSKLEIYENDRKIVHYDRMWGMQPKGAEEEHVFRAILEFLKKAPKRFF